jgi:hypothetical protein
MLVNALDPGQAVEQIEGMLPIVREPGDSG